MILSHRKKRCKNVSICLKLKKGVFFHSEDSCWFKTKENKENEKKQIKHIDNFELECELQCKDPKN